MPTTTYVVSGMTCGHCVRAVTDEVGGLPEVDDVAVDLATGRLTVTSTPEIAYAVVEAAVDEAGYALSPA